MTSTLTYDRDLSSSINGSPTPATPPAASAAGVPALGSSGRGISRRGVFGLAGGLAAAFTAGPLLAACGTGTGSASKSQKLTMGIPSAPDTLDPGATGLALTLLMSFTMFDPLVWWLPDANGVTGSFHPGLATSYTVSPDAATYTFKLRTDVTFHDGTKFDATAVKATYDHIVDPATKSRSGLGALGPYKETKIIDPHTVQIVFSQPNASFLHQQAAGNFGIASPTALKRYGATGFGNHPVGSGPFVFGEYASGDHLTVTRNPDYRWGPAALGTTGPAALESITFRIVADDSGRYNALQAGQLQIAMNLPPNDISSVTRAHTFNQVTVQSIGTPIGLPMNVTKSPTDDVRVRRAIQYAVDQNKLVKEVLFGVDTPAHNVLTPITPGYSKPASGIYNYDPAKAASLLESAGWTMGANNVRTRNGQQLSLDILLFSGGGLELPTQFVVSELAKVGFAAQTTVKPFATVATESNQGVQNLGAFGYYGADPYLLNIWVNSDAIKSGFNWSHYSNPSIDSMIARANVTADESARDSLYENISTTLMNDAIYLPLWDVNGEFTTAHNLRGLKPTLNGYILFHSARLD
jgi:peptide/nickel transport system substrate-binding protein